MTHKIHHEGGLTYKVSGTIASNRLNTEHDKFLGAQAGHANIKGFRQGKVPKQRIQDSGSVESLESVAHHLVEEFYRDFLKDEKLSTIGESNFDIKSPFLGQDLQFEISYELYPDFTLPDIEAQSIETYSLELADSDIETMLEQFQAQRGTWATLAEGAEKKDRVQIDFEGSIDGKVFEGGTAEKQWLEVGIGRLLPEMESALEGMKAGEEKTFDLTFPQEYPKQDLAGQTAQFKVKVYEVQRLTPRDLDESLFEELKVKDLDELKANMIEEMKREATRTIEDHKHGQALKVISDLCEFDLPDRFLQSNAEQMRADEMARYESQTGQAPDESSFPDTAQFIPRAKGQAKQGFVFSKLLDHFSIKIDQTILKSFLNERFSVPEEQFDKILQELQKNPDQWNAIQGQLLESLLMEKLLKVLKVEEKAVDFQTLMAINQNNQS